jgi:phenylalanine-4-hydroxylase
MGYLSMADPNFRFERSKDLSESQYVVDQEWDKLTEEDHDIWRILYKRQANILKKRAAKEWYEGMNTLKIGTDGVPNYERVSDILEKLTGWRLVATAGLVPDDVFFTHFANKRFPVTRWMRDRDQIDYIVEPDAFHDCYGHVAHLSDPRFAEFLHFYGKEGLKAIENGTLTYLARLYWYTVEFGLLNTPDGLKIYGAGIASSPNESVYALENPASQRIKLDIERCMRTDYIIHTYQATYFVIDDYSELLEGTSPSRLAQFYANIADEPCDYAPDEKLAEDLVFPPAQSGSYD